MCRNVSGSNIFLTYEVYLYEIIWKMMRYREINMITQYYNGNFVIVTHKTEVPRGARGEKCK